MVATQLIVCPSIGRALVERIVGAQIGLQPERDADEAARTFWRIGRGFARDLGFDHGARDFIAPIVDAATRNKNGATGAVR